MNAAFEEFGEHGYAKASTNRIVQRAGISKGMLFYYFNSKKELYHDLIDAGISFIRDKYLLKIDETQTDFIEKYKLAGVLKMQAYHENPHAFHFFGSLYLHRDRNAMSEEAKAQMDAVRALGMEKLFTHVDRGLFREDIAPERVYQMIRWCMDGYEKDLTQRLQGQPLSEANMTPHWEEFYAYLDILKKVFYTQST